MRAIQVEKLNLFTLEGPSFHDLNFELETGEAVVFTSVGPANLEALLEVLAGLREPSGGGVNWERVPRSSELAEKIGLRRRYRLERWVRLANGFVSNKVTLLENLDVFENIALPLRYHFQPPSSIVEERVEQLMRLLKLTRYRGVRPARLSRGAYRRVALGRALILEPTCLFLHDPLANMDSESREIFLGALSHFVERVGLTVGVGTIEPLPFLSLAPRIFVIHHGSLRDVIEEPGDERQFIDRMAELRLSLRRGAPRS